MQVACWLVVIACAGVVALQLLGGRVGRWVTPVQALTPWVLPWAIAASVIAVLDGRHSSATAGAAVSIAYLGLVAPLAFPARLPEPLGRERLTVTHANLLFGNPSIADTIDALIAADADVIAVSELTPQLAATIEVSMIGVAYPYSVLRPGPAALGLGLWSRVPLSTGEPVLSSSMSLKAEIALGQRMVQLVLAHPLPPLFHAPRWQAELAELTAIDATTMARTVLVADLNVSYFHPPYRRFLDDTGLTDVHQALGEGFSVSWPTNGPVPPFVRLDHATVGRELTATAIADHDVPGSDHRAFTVTVAWAG